MSKRHHQLGPRLPVLDTIVSQTNLLVPDKLGLDKIGFVCIQHILITTVSLFESLIALGAKPENIHLLGKSYSLSPTVLQRLKQLHIQVCPLSQQQKLGHYQDKAKQDANQLWRQAMGDFESKSIRGVIILDEGGRLRSCAPSDLHKKYPVTAVEQTTAGMRLPNVQNVPFKTISVARSAAKVQLEPPIIAETIIDKLSKIFPHITQEKTLACGVVGHGAVGEAVAAALASWGHQVVVHDIKKNVMQTIAHLPICDTFEELLAKSTHIIGCTGTDIAQNIPVFDAIDADKTLISCSSEDKEFRSLLQKKQQLSDNTPLEDSLADVFYETEAGATLRIVRGGFPVSFDNSEDGARAEQIQLTRGLLLCGLLQAYTLLPDYPEQNQANIFQLDSTMQSFVAHTFHHATNSLSESQIESFQNNSWISQQSGRGASTPNWLSPHFTLPTDIEKSESTSPSEHKLTLTKAQAANIEQQRAETMLTHRVTVSAIEKMLYKPIPVLDHGFIRVVDYMGDDTAVIQAARVSYGKGTEQVRKDQRLINYLMRHRHTTPFEMCEIKLHIKLPIFAARHLLRHRTASANEYSARYSVLENEFYIPSIDQVAVQSNQNRQGRGKPLSPPQAQQVLDILIADANRSYHNYQWMLNEDKHGEPLNAGRDGVARELARINLSTAVYTQLYWKIDLHNLLHFLQLRADSHAQYEIRVYAEKIMEIVAKWVPMTFHAFQEYRVGAATFSASALQVIQQMLQGKKVRRAETTLSKREWNDLLTTLTIKEG